MCGIAGLIDWSREPRNLLPEAREMSARLAHRGPDGAGEWSEPGVALAHRRLALLDHKNGAQPYHSADGRYVMVYNGEVYNFRELRKELDGPFRSDCDSEVVLAAFMQWGPECVKRFNGMFAFFIWDRRTKEGFAVRDQAGVKPLLYRFENEEFTFASEAKALVTDSPKVDLEAVLEYLVAPCFSGVETSPFSGIEILDPGHWMKISATGMVVTKWREEFREINLQDEAPDLREVIQEAVSRSLVADEELGCYLSGGFDSTLITALAKPSRCFSVNFEGRGEFELDCSQIVISDDLPFAKSAAAELGVSLTLARVLDCELEGRLKKISSTNDLLPAWEQEIAQDALAAEATKFFKAILVGDAADETHYGYHFLLDAKDPAGIFEPLAMAPIRCDLMESPVNYFDDKYRKLTPDLTSLVIERWLPRLLHNGDIHAMTHGLESRVPFTDIELWKLAEHVSPEAGRDKAWLRYSVKGLMPEEIRLRRKSALPKAPRGWLTYRRLVKERFLDVAAEVLEMDALMKILAKENPDEREQGLFFRLCGLGFWSENFKVTWK